MSEPGNFNDMIQKILEDVKKNEPKGTDAGEIPRETLVEIRRHQEVILEKMHEMCEATGYHPSFVFSMYLGSALKYAAEHVGDCPFMYVVIESTAGNSAILADHWKEEH